ncbi:unnamed protein product, partial [Scytosiphon promiscuus]
KAAATGRSSGRVYKERRFQRRERRHTSERQREGSVPPSDGLLKLWTPRHRGQDRQLTHQRHQQDRSRSRRSSGASARGTRSTSVGAPYQAAGSTRRRSARHERRCLPGFS